MKVCECRLAAIGVGCVSAKPAEIWMGKEREELLPAISGVGCRVKDFPAFLPSNQIACGKVKAADDAGMEEVKMGKRQMCLELLRVEERRRRDPKRRRRRQTGCNWQPHKHNQPKLPRP
jgi:hypothetical protein